MPLKPKTILYIVLGIATVSVVYMCWNKKKEWLSGLGYGTGMLGSNYGPIYEGFTPDAEKKDTTEGYCGACS